MSENKHITPSIVPAERSLTPRCDLGTEFVQTEGFGLYFNRSYFLFNAR